MKRNEQSAANDRRVTEPRLNVARQPLRAAGGVFTVRDCPPYMESYNRCLGDFVFARRRRAIRFNLERF